MRPVVLLLSLIVLSAEGANGQHPLFPALKGYKSVSDYPVYTPDDLWDYIDGAADAYLALGFIDLNIIEYVRGKVTIKAELYRFGDDAKSFGIYSLERSPGYRFINAGVQGYNEEGAVNFYKGNYYIKIMTHSKSRKVNEAMVSLAGMIADNITGTNEFPVLLKLYPSEGLLKNQETYILSDVMGHEFLRDAFRASYEVEGDRFDIYLFSCATPDEAVSAAAKLSGMTPSGSDETEKYIVEDGFNGLLHLVRKGRLLIVVSGLGSDKTALADRYINMMLNR